MPSDKNELIVNIEIAQISYVYKATTRSKNIGTNIKLCLQEKYSTNIFRKQPVLKNYTFY